MVLPDHAHAGGADVEGRRSPSLEDVAKYAARDSRQLVSMVGSADRAPSCAVDSSSVYRVSPQDAF